jgi:dTDP-4-amino-4,6-dideoxygalactose transaminase
MSIEMVDLAAQNAEIQPEVDELLAQVHTAAAYVGGRQVADFEQAFASFLGVEHVVGVSSGTDALRLALIALGIGAGDTVITTPMTFIATAAAIVQSGARPVFVDIDPATGNICPRAVEHYLDTHRRDTVNRPRAIIPVDLYGLPAQMAKLRELATAFGLKLIEDACQAHGARFLAGGKWHIAGGALADAACFSFYPGKNLGAWGDGGAVATDDAAIAARVARLRDHGRESHHEHSILGYNARLDTIQAAVLRVKLKRLSLWNQRRQAIAARYRELLDGTEIELLGEPHGFESAYHLYVIRTGQRDRLQAALTTAEIEHGIHYPVPLHLQPACRFLGYRAGDFPFAEQLAATALSIPIHPHLSDAAVERVAAVARGALGTR